MKEVERFDYNKGDYAAINDNLMDIDWTSKFIGMTTEEMWIYFSNTLTDQMEKYIPITTYDMDDKKSYRQTQKKQCAWKKYKETGNKWDYVQTTNENKTNMMTRKLCRVFEYNLARNMKQNPKAFWRYCKSKMKNRSKRGDLKMADSKLTGDDDKTKAEFFFL